MPWRRRAENLAEVDLRAPEVLEEPSLKTAKAWGSKERAAMLWRFKHRGWAIRAWRHWLGRVMRGRPEPMKWVARRIRDHRWGVVNAIVHGITDAGSEATAARVQRIQRRACGYRDLDRFMNAILRPLAPEVVEQARTQSPLGRIGRPEEVAAVIRFLCSDDASYVTGSIVRVDGGQLC